MERITLLGATPAMAGCGASSMTVSAAVQASEWGLQAFSSSPSDIVRVPMGHLTAIEKRKRQAAMAASHRGGVDRAPEWYADCRKKRGTGSGLTYTAGHVRVAGVEQSQQVHGQKATP